jgi:3',5'-cyclic AMP phosphodiesterase CpdA
MEYLEDFLVLYLDSSKGIIEQEQLKWLNDSLIKNQKDILTFIHHPIVDCGNTVMDRMYPLRNRSDVYNMLRDSGKKVYIFSGHYHWEQEVLAGNIKQYVTPSLLYQLDKNADILRIGSKNFGFRVINISMNKVETYVETLTTSRVATSSD